MVKIAFSTLLPRGDTVVFHNHPLDFLYTRLQTGRMMVWWCPSRSPSIGLSVRPGLRLPVFFALFSYMVWHINFAHDFVLMYYGSSLSVVTLRQFLKELCLFVNSEYRKCSVFPDFSPSWFDILSWNFAFVICFNVLQIKFECRHFASILKELCLFVDLKHRKCEVVRTFLLHALRYWA